MTRCNSCVKGAKFPDAGGWKELLILLFLKKLLLFLFFIFFIIILFISINSKVALHATDNSLVYSKWTVKNKKIYVF